MERTLTYDAAGRQVGTFDPAVHTCCEIDRTDAASFDGDGQLVKAVSTAGPNPSSTEYKFRSTVLGGEAVGTLTTTATTPSTEVKQFTVPVLGGIGIGVIGIGVTSAILRFSGRIWRLWRDGLGSMWKAVFII